MKKQTSQQFYWSRIFTPAILLLVLMALYLLFTVPKIQTISSSSLAKTIRAMENLKI